MEYNSQTEVKASLPRSFSCDTVVKGLILIAYSDANELEAIELHIVWRENPWGNDGTLEWFGAGRRDRQGESMVLPLCLAERTDPRNATERRVGSNKAKRVAAFLIIFRGS